MCGYRAVRGIVSWYFNSASSAYPISVHPDCYCFIGGDFRFLSQPQQQISLTFPCFPGHFFQQIPGFDFLTFSA